MTELIAPSLDRPAPSLSEDRECPICENEGTYVDIGFNGVCTVCSHAPDSKEYEGGDDDGWTPWFEHRDDRYSGLHGDDRKKCVGGFAAAYEFDTDFV